MFTDRQWNQIKFMRATASENSISMWLKHLDFDDLSEQQIETIHFLCKQNSNTRRKFVIVDDRAVKGRTSRATLWQKTKKGYKKTSMREIGSKYR